MDAFRVARRLGFWLAMAAALGGCDKKTRECNQVVETVNHFEASKNGEPPNDPKAHAAILKGVADAEEATAGELAKLAPTAPELVQLSTRFQVSFKANATATRDLAALIDRIPDAGAQKVIEDKVTAAREAIDGAEQRIEAKCSADAAACASFAPVLKKHPDSDAIEANDVAKTKAWADAVTAWSSELSQAEVKDPAVREELLKLLTGYKDLGAVIVELGQISADAPKRKAAHDAQAAGAKEIGSLVEELNKFCQAP